MATWPPGRPILLAVKGITVPHRRGTHDAPEGWQGRGLVASTRLPKRTGAPGRSSAKEALFAHLARPLRQGGPHVREPPYSPAATPGRGPAGDAPRCKPNRPSRASPATVPGRPQCREAPFTRSQVKPRVGRGGQQVVKGGEEAVENKGG